MTTPNPAHAAGVSELTLLSQLPATSQGALPTSALNLPSAELIAQLANRFFAALPGAASAQQLDLNTAPSPSGVPALLPTAFVQPTAPTLAPTLVGAQASPTSTFPPEPDLSRVQGVSSTSNGFELPALASSVPSSTPTRSSSSLPLPRSFDAVTALLRPVETSLGAVREPATLGAYFLDEAVAALNRGTQPFLFDALKLRPESTQYDPARIPSFDVVPRPFDPYAIRNDFPILREQVHGRRLIWLDNGATTQKPQSVIDRLKYFYEHENSNIHRAAHTLAARATDAYEAAREKVRKFLNAPSTKEIIFVRGTTEGINLVAQSWGRQNVGSGDEIVVTHLEHHANIVPWQQLAAEKGARLRVAPVDDSGQIILEEFEKLLNPRTKIVAITQVSNALGTITPVQAMAALAHRHGICVLVDGAQAVSHMPVDVQVIGADFYVFSGHKVFAPTGIGAVYGRQVLLDSMPPWQGGGNMIADVTFERTVYQPAPAKFEAGTGNIADAVGLGAAIDYVSAIGLHSISLYEHGLLEYATARLRSVPGLKLYGHAKEKAGVLSFTLDGYRPDEVGKALDREGIAVRAGHHCAQPILRRFGVEGTVRASLAPYNTCEDIDALVAALLKLKR